MTDDGLKTADQFEARNPYARKALRLAGFIEVGHEQARVRNATPELGVGMEALMTTYATLAHAFETYKARQ